MRSLFKSIVMGLWLVPTCGFSQWDDSLLRPFVMDHRAANASSVDLSFLLEGPAGKEGFIRVQNGHFVKGNGQRIRFWGVHLTDWSKGSVLLPPKEDIPMWVGTLARFGVNMVRLHFLDLPAPRGIISAAGDDSRSFDAQQLDRLDFLVSELKKRGIYMDLNLNVGRSYKAGDNVKDYDKIQWGKGLTLFDPRLIELEKEYAKALLTHQNPYTKTEYRNEPAIAIVEILNENGIGIGFRSPSPYYAAELTEQYNTWLNAKLSAPERAVLRQQAGVAGEGPIPLLKGAEVSAAPRERFQAEMSFYMQTEDHFYQDMSGYLKKTLGVKAPITGTADHGHSNSSYPMLTSLQHMDVIDGHVYWQHPGAPGPVNTAMVNDPLHSTVVQLSRTAIAGKPYTVSETNHPFPNDWSSEGIPIIAAYGNLQDWDAIIFYTFEPKLSADWNPYIGDPFDISLDPVRMTQFATGALSFLRGDIHPAKTLVERSYSPEQVRESKRLPRTEEPYFTPGFPLALPLEHEVRIGTLNGLTTEKWPSDSSAVIPSDTGELTWSTSPQNTGVVTVNTERTQSLIGFLKANPKPLKNLSADLHNNFAALTLTTMDGKPITSSAKMLFTAASRVTNTGLQRDASGRRVANIGESPTLIEPVTGTVTLRNLQSASHVTATPLDGSGRPLGTPMEAQKLGDGWKLKIGTPVTTWYIVSVQRTK